MIYLDNAATTRPSPTLGALFADYQSRGWYNPSALYAPAVAAEAAMEAARKTLTTCVHADKAIFTSGGTEAANMAILQGWPKKGGRKMHFITSAYEHACVFEAFRSLEEVGHRVDYLRPGPDGRISPDMLSNLVSDDTALVGIMHVNNELGAVNDVCALAKTVKEKNPSTLFFADGVQAFLRVPFDMSTSAVDYYTASAHKIHGLKGTGVLFHKKSVHPQPILIGGGQESSLRSGTENTFGILAFARATEEFLENHAAKLSRMEAVKERLQEGLLKIPGAVTFSPNDGAPHILNIAFPGMAGEVLLHALEEQDICIATGAACSSKKKAYRVHEALGVPRELAQCAVRISFCPDNTETEADAAIDAIFAALKKYQRFVRR